MKILKKLKYNKKQLTEKYLNKLVTYIKRMTFISSDDDGSGWSLTGTEGDWDRLRRLIKEIMETKHEI